MGFEEQSLFMALKNEKEGGTVVTTNPVDDRIKNPKSKSKNETTLWKGNVHFGGWFMS